MTVMHNALLADVASMVEYARRSERNLEQMRGFYLGWPIPQTLPANSIPSSRQISQALSAKSDGSPRIFPPRFPLPWTH
jgi:hypothetical protein